MSNIGLIYRQLQQHLDKQPVGYPKTFSGVELKLLKHIFSPEEAELAMNLDYKFRPASHIIAKIDNADLSVDVLEKKLFDLARKGGVSYRDKEGTDTFALIPLIVGMYEGFLDQLSPEFLKDFRKYTNSLPFGLSFLSTNRAQMRTIPVEESVSPENRISTFDEVIHLLENSEGPFAAIECICRKAASIDGDPCRATDRKETCMTVNGLAKGVLKAEIGTEMSKDEAISLIRKNTEEGLILQPSNTKDIEFICSCCGCCCGMLGVHKKLPNPADYWPTNFFAQIDYDACNGCGVCARTCQIEAIKFKKNKGKQNSVKVNLKRCLGCGNCVVACKFEGIHLKKKVVEKIPPENHDDLYDTIMQNKNDKWHNVKTVSKAILGLPGDNY